MEIGRDYWLKKAEPTVGLAEEISRLLAELDPKLHLSYKQEFLGITAQNRPANFIVFWPKKTFLRLRVKLAEAEEWAKKLRKVGIDVVRIKPGQFLYLKVSESLRRSQRRLFKELCRKAYEERFSDSE